MKINCLSCGHNFTVGEAYEDYDGAVKCNICRTLLRLRTMDGKVKAVEPLILQAAAD